MAECCATSCVADDVATLVEQTGRAALYLVDDVGRVVDWRPSAESLFGWTAKEMLGQSLEALELDGSNAMQRFRGQVAEGQPPIRLVNRRKDGSVFQAEVTTLAMHEAGEVCCYARAVRDLTLDIEARARATKDVSTLQSAVIDLPRLRTGEAAAKALADELARPLAAAANYFESIRDLSGETGQDLAGAKEAAAAGAQIMLRAGDAVRRFQLLVTREPGKRHREQLSTLVTASLQHTRRTLANHAITITADVDALLLVDVASKDVEQILICLLTNAVQAYDADQPGSIAIRARPIADNLIQVSVSDSGRGMPDELLADRFIPFAGKASGQVGLGLSICQSLVEAAGGTLRARRRPAGGTTLQFTLPASQGGIVDA